MPCEIRVFWSTFHWVQNAWFVDAQGKHYVASQWKWFRECRLGDFLIVQLDTGKIRVHLPVFVKRPSVRGLGRFEAWL